MPELLVDEVVRVDQDRPAGRRELSAAVLVVADQLLLLGVDADHRLPGRQRRRRPLGDPPKLCVTVGMIGSLVCLAVGLQAVPQPLEQPAHRALVTTLNPCARSAAVRLATLRSSTEAATPDRPRRIKQRQERLPQTRLALLDRRRPGAGAPAPPARARPLSSAIPRRTVASEIPVALTTAAIPPRPCERASAAAHNRRPRSSSSSCTITPPLPDRAFVDHNPQFYITNPTPSETKSGALRGTLAIRGMTGKPKARPLAGVRCVGPGDARPASGSQSIRRRSSRTRRQQWITRTRTPGASCHCSTADRTPAASCCRSMRRESVPDARTPGGA